MRSTKNRDIRDKAASERVFLYEIAQRIGISYSSLIVWLRDDLSEAKRKQILCAIDELSSSRK